MSVAGVVTALDAEARTLGLSRRRSDGLRALRDGTLLAVGGMGLSAADSAARRLVQAGASSLVSWGMAGGLDPALPAGTLCIPGTVVSRDGESFATDLHWRELLVAAIAARRVVASGRLFSSAVPIEDAAGKAAAFERTGAAVVDMESMAIARVAAAHGMPFVVVRAIVDTATDVLPAAVLSATTPEGVRMARLVLGMLRAPSELSPLLRLARRYRAATRALAAAAGSGALAPLAYAATSPTRVA